MNKALVRVTLGEFCVEVPLPQPGEGEELEVRFVCGEENRKVGWVEGEAQVELGWRDGIVVVDWEFTGLDKELIEAGELEVYMEGDREKCLEEAARGKLRELFKEMEQRRWVDGIRFTAWFCEWEVRLKKMKHGWFVEGKEEKGLTIKEDV